MESQSDMLLCALVLYSTNYEFMLSIYVWLIQFVLIPILFPPIKVTLKPYFPRALFGIPWSVGEGLPMGH